MKIRQMCFFTSVTSCIIDSTCCDGLRLQWAVPWMAAGSCSMNHSALMQALEDPVVLTSKLK